MPVTEPLPARALLDREIMLRCLADAAETADAADFAAGRPARRVLELRLRTTETRRAAALLREQARAMRGAPDGPPSILAHRRAILSGLSMHRMVLDIRRADLWMTREAAAERRSDAQALRAQAEQLRRHRRR
ncbi:hypothetical protein DVA67_016880 [Solirubrobacter sp. CPCC 204708]|uniref:DUF222 domain-containing protein n=1 Tax=Solirubrobacter deserti TaxID=2282478 RepID=A0ABT4RJ91_9ACTN|nr:hypothetical protein [Solirubrobacter deserti]MBE2317659.1 hypothetical protein [Solirubrobacter deserti]MDA0138609.1 hypothetical protein [Solirubrobacter deserti]